MLLSNWFVEIDFKHKTFSDNRQLPCYLLTNNMYWLQSLSFSFIKRHKVTNKQIINWFFWRIVLFECILQHLVKNDKMSIETLRQYLDKYFCIGEELLLLFWLLLYVFLNSRSQSMNYVNPLFHYSILVNALDFSSSILLIALFAIFLCICVVSLFLSLLKIDEFWVVRSMRM